MEIKILANNGEVPTKKVKIYNKKLIVGWYLQVINDWNW